MRIIKNSQCEVSISYHHNFGQVDKHGNIQLRMGFECTETGEILPLKHDAAKANLVKALTGIDGLVSMGIQKYSHSWNSHAIGECSYCQKHVVLDGFTNTCNCGADYNMSGQLLADRSQWGEDTGETASDILRIR